MRRFDLFRLAFQNTSLRNPSPMKAGVIEKLRMLREKRERDGKEEEEEEEESRTTEPSGQGGVDGGEGASAGTEGEGKEGHREVSAGNEGEGDGREGGESEDEGGGTQEPSNLILSREEEGGNRKRKSRAASRKEYTEALETGKCTTNRHLRKPRTPITQMDPWSVPRRVLQGNKATTEGGESGESIRRKRQEVQRAYMLCF